MITTAAPQLDEATICRVRLTYRFSISAACPTVASLTSDLPDTAQTGLVEFTQIVKAQVREREIKQRVRSWTFHFLLCSKRLETRAIFELWK